MNPWYGQPMPPNPYNPGYPGYPPELPLESPGPGYPYPPQAPQQQSPFPEQPRSEQKPLLPLREIFKRRSRRSYLLAHQMSEALGQQVNVATYVGEVKGEVAGVYPDHLLLQQEEKKYHVRWDGIVYVCPTGENQAT